ncbi:hypothetical protein [Fodinibius sp.]|uniref:hypothetical protein n=1 Tax=Fodinibius sp. TaxID=1872440 RepID=UPI002ACE6FDE|nr:hypothetical protein [Fodinibius sp.]MDZ7659640.1 hypothetical protein [Fodinibius sp.]
MQTIKELISTIGPGNIINSLLFLLLDLFIVFVVINSILSWRDSKRWAPLRKDIFEQAHLVVFLIFHSCRSALKKDPDYDMDVESINTMNHFVDEVRRKREKFSNRLALYGSGLGEKMLPQMAVINEECEELILYLQFSLLPFDPRYKDKDYYFYNSFPYEKLEKAVTALEEVKSNHSKKVADKEISKDEGFDTSWLKSYYKRLSKLHPKIVTSPEEIEDDISDQVMVLGHRELMEIGSNPTVQKMKIQTLRTT